MLTPGQRVRVLCVCEILTNELRSVILCMALVQGLLWHQPPDPFWLLDNLSPKQLPRPLGKPRLTPLVLLHTHDNKHRRSKETIIAVYLLRAYNLLSRTPPTGFLLKKQTLGFTAFHHLHLTSAPIRVVFLRRLAVVILFFKGLS